MCGQISSNIDVCDVGGVNGAMMMVGFTVLGKI